MTNSGSLDRNFEPLCETSEPSERLIARNEMLPISLMVGRRILEVFGYQRLPQIAFRLKLPVREIAAVLSGERLPSTEMLLCMSRLTGVSVDWILTGHGVKFISPAPPSAVYESLSSAVIAAHLDHQLEETRYLQ